MAVNTHQPENVQRRLLVSIDFGTAFSAVAHTIVSTPPDERSTPPALGTVSPYNLKNVQFSRDCQVSSQVAWHKDGSGGGQWEWGPDVDEFIERGEILESDRIQMVKLCLEESPLSQATRTRVKAQLDGLPPLAWQILGLVSLSWAERLVSLFLGKLWAEAKGCINMSRAETFDDDESVECWLGVPK